MYLPHLWKFLTLVASQFKISFQFKINFINVKQKSASTNCLKIPLQKKIGLKKTYSCSSHSKNWYCLPGLSSDHFALCFQTQSSSRRFQKIKGRPQSFVCVLKGSFVFSSSGYVHYT